MNSKPKFAVIYGIVDVLIVSDFCYLAFPLGCNKSLFLLTLYVALDFDFQ